MLFAWFDIAAGMKKERKKGKNNTIVGGKKSPQGRLKACAPQSSCLFAFLCLVGRKKMSRWGKESVFTFARKSVFSLPGKLFFLCEKTEKEKKGVDRVWVSRSSISFA